MFPFFCLPKRLVAHEYLSFICFLRISTSTHLSFFILPFYYHYLIFFFFFFFGGSNQASFEMLISLWKCCVFKYGVKLPRFGLQLFALTPPTRKKERKKKRRKAYGESTSFVTWVKCAPCFQNVFKCVWFDWAANRMALHVSSGIHPLILVISEEIFHISHFSSSIWVPWQVLCSEMAPEYKANCGSFAPNRRKQRWYEPRQGTLMRPAVREGKARKAKVYEIIHSQMFDCGNKMLILAIFDKV